MMKSHSLIILFSTYFIALIISLFFGYKGQLLIAHITGIITALCCFFATLFFGIFAKIDYKSRLCGCLSFFCLAMGYVLYLLFHISPSSYDFPAHSYISMLFDVGTSGVAVFSFLLYKTKLNKGNQ